MFKWEWLSDIYPGYIVYRHVFDLEKCTLEDGVKAHMVAAFKTENEAADYCEYRNYMTERYGSDDVDLITTYDP